MSQSPYAEVAEVPVSRYGPRYHANVLRSKVPLDHCAGKTPTNQQSSPASAGSCGHGHYPTSPGIRTDYPEVSHIYKDTQPTHFRPQSNQTRGILTSPQQLQSDVFPHQPRRELGANPKGISTYPNAPGSRALPPGDSGLSSPVSAGRHCAHVGGRSTLPLYPQSPDAPSSGGAGGKRCNPDRQRSNVVFGGPGTTSDN